MYWYRLQKAEFKITLIVLICPTMKGLVEVTMYISQGELIMSGGDSQWGMELCPAPEIISRYVQPS